MKKKMKMIRIVEDHKIRGEKRHRQEGSVGTRQAKRAAKTPGEKEEEEDEEEEQKEEEEEGKLTARASEPSPQSTSTENKQKCTARSLNIKTA